MATQPNEQHVWTIPADLRLQLLAALSAPDQLPKLTFEEFLKWAGEDTRAEWADGVVEMPSPASARHQQIVQFLLRVFATFLEIKPLGSVFVASFLMRLANAAREPDLLLVATAHLDRLKPTYLDGAADLVVEVVSPESIGRDRGDKLVEYEQAGIPEYWVINPEAEPAEFWRLNAKGCYESVAPSADGTHYSTILTGLWLREAWLWQDPLSTSETPYWRFSPTRVRPARAGTLPARGPSPEGQSWLRQPRDRKRASDALSAGNPMRALYAGAGNPTSPSPPIG